MLFAPSFDRIRPRFAAWVFGALCTQALAQSALPVNAHDAASAVQRSATVVDVRSHADYAQGHLPTAVSLAQATGVSSREPLQALVSTHGIDLSREVLVVGAPGDAAAMRFANLLAQHASARVHWLVGGVTEWQMTGLAVSTQPSDPKLPVPQYLVAQHAEPLQARMAGAVRRTSLAPPVQAANNASSAGL